jgi:hypothetical protein
MRPSYLFLIRFPYLKFVFWFWFFAAKFAISRRLGNGQGIFYRFMPLPIVCCGLVFCRHVRQAALLQSVQARSTGKKDAMTALPRWRDASQNTFHQLSQCNVSGALRPKSATSPPGRTRVVESGTRVINGLGVTVQRRRNAFAIAVEK